MDYREVANRLERNQDMIKERAYDRLIEAAKQAERANRPPRRSWFATLRLMLASLSRHKDEWQAQAQSQSPIQLTNPCPETPKQSYQA